MFETKKNIFKKQTNFDLCKKKKNPRNNLNFRLRILHYIIWVRENAENH